MISVEQLIGDLLLRHNCVIVPTFGGFVANQTSAVIDYTNGVMSPPKKSLLFNRQLVNNDGLLVAEFAAINNLTYDTSKASIEQLIQSWNDLLKKGERVTLDRVGHLYFDQERNICFEQDRFFNLLLESYGLGKVHFITEEDVRIVAHQASEQSQPQEALIKVIDFEHIEHQPVLEGEPKIIEHPILKEKTKVWRYIAAACLLPIAFYSFWIPVRTDVLESGMLSIKDFNPFYNSAEGKYAQQRFEFVKDEAPAETLEEMVSKLPSDVAVFSYPFDADLYIPVKIHGESTIEVTAVEPVETIVIKPEGNFNIIVGCFGDANNAKNLVSKLVSEGFSAFIVDEVNGLSRVSIGNVNSNAEAQELSSKAKSLGYTGWILNK
jgi:hypothetical protein